MILFYFLCVRRGVWNNFEMINKQELGRFPKVPLLRSLTAQEGSHSAYSAQGKPHTCHGHPLHRLPLPAAVNHHRDQVVHAVQVHRIAGGVEEPEFQGEDHSVGQLGVPVQLLHVLEPL